MNANNYRFLLEQTDASNITGTIKLFFRELTTPLLPLKYIEEIIVDEKLFMSKTKKDNIQHLKPTRFHFFRQRVETTSFGCIQSLQTVARH